MNTKKLHLDNLIVEKGLAPTLHIARSLIMAGRVIVDDHMTDKPGCQVSELSHIRIKNPRSNYVSRGGEKLEKALDVFNVSVKEKTALDVGVSTGGFTDCLLQKGASKVFAVDVGYGQLAWKLQKDKRVIVLERTNIRTLAAEIVQPQPNLAVVDVSFISLKKILSRIITLLASDGAILCLIKPQFEVKQTEVGKGGIVRDPRQHQDVVDDMVRYAGSLSLQVIGVQESPILGQKGNREFFLYSKKVN